MNQKKVRNEFRLDYQFRIFLLSLLDGRERSSKEIDNAIKLNYSMKQYTIQRIQIILNKLVKFHCLSKNKHERIPEDRSMYSYVITHGGRKRLQYYKDKWKEIQEQKNQP